MTKVIKNGTFVTADREGKADVRIDGDGYAKFSHYSDLRTEEFLG